MTRFLARRLALAVPTLLGVVTICFVLLRLMPGDPARTIAGPQATPATIEHIRRQIGLDGSWLHQYWTYLSHLAHGNLGTSSVTGRPVTHEIATRLPYTVELALAAIALSLVLGLMLGIVMATKRGRPLDTAIGAASVIGVSMPVYWTGLLLIVVFSVQLRWLPASGAETISGLVLPTVALCLFPLAFISRQTRSSMVGVLGEDYSRTALAKGAGWPRRVFKHALRNAAVPIVTITGLELGQLLGGAILTETVFSWPGVGQLLVQSITSRDFVVVQGVVLVFAICLIGVNLVTDIIYTVLDPRLRHER